MFARMMVAVAVAVLVAVGANFATGGMGAVQVTVKPLSPSDKIPTFAQVQAELRGEPSAAARDAEPWAGADRNSREVRKRAREDALSNLDGISSTCQPGDSERFAKALAYYLEHRRIQERVYANNWGKAGAAFIAEAWTSPEDLRIVEMMRAAYQAGRLSLNDFESRRRDQVAWLIGDVKQSTSRCS